MKSVIIPQLQLKEKSDTGLRSFYRQYVLMAIGLLILGFNSTNSWGQAATAAWAGTTDASVAVTGNVAGGSQTFGSALTGTGFSATNGFQGQTWPTGALSTAQNNYYQFSIGPTTGNNLSITSLSLQPSISGPGTATWAVYYSTSPSFTSPVQIGSNTTVNSTTPTTTTFSSLSISVTSGNTIYLRFLAGSADASTRNIRLRNFTINGTTTASAATITSNGTGGGTWATGSTWVGGVAPTSAENAVIAAGDVVTVSSAITRNSGTSTTVNATGKLATDVTITNNGTANINGSFQLNSGGWATGTGTFVYGAAGTLVFNNSTSYGVNSGDVFWPTTSGPVNVTVLQGGFTLNAAANRTIAGTLQTASGVTLSGATLTLNGVTQLNSGGFFANTPIYGAASSLIYNNGGTFGAGSEWAAGATTNAAGAPNAVTIQNNTAVNFGASTSARQANGLVTIGSGSSLTMSSASGGDLRITTGLTNNNSGSGVGISTSAAALIVAGTGTYTKAGTDNLGILAFATASTLTLATGTNINLTNTSAACLQFTAAGTLSMGGTNTVSIASGTTVTSTATGTISGASATTSILSFAGSCTWSPGGVITMSSGVGVQLNGGLTNTTATRFNAINVQINDGGFVSSNPIVYGSASRLIYNKTLVSSYGVGANEWPTTSGPVNVTVQGQGIDFGTNNQGARTVTGTLTLNASVNLNGSGTPSLTAATTIANATATVFGTGAYTQSASGSFTTANVAGINGTLTTGGTITLPITTSFSFTGAASQVTGVLLPATVAALTINNTAGGTNGVTISNNTLTISGITTLTAGALILPTGAGNLVTFTGAIAGTSGTVTGSPTSNITTSANLTSPFSLSFTAGGQALNNWTCTPSIFGSVGSYGLASPLNISGTLLLGTANQTELVVVSGGSITMLSGSTYNNGPQTSYGTVEGAGAFTLNAGANFITGSGTGLWATGTTVNTNGTIIVSGTRTFSGAANYTFINATTTQAIGTALDAAGGSGKTGVITGNLVFDNQSSAGVSLTAGITITVNSPGTVTIGSATTAGTLTAPATAVINGSGNINMLGNGATTGSTLITGSATGVNGTFAGTGTFNLTNGANNNTNFTFNGTAVQVTGTLLPATINNLAISNSTASTSPTADVTLSSSVTVNGAFTNSGRLGVGANTLTLNGGATFTTNKLVTTSSSNLIIGGSGTISGATPFISGGVTVNNFTMNRAATTFTANPALTVAGAFSLSNGVVSLGATLTLSGAITFGSGTLTGGGNPLVINGSGSITGNLTATSTPLALSTLTINRAGATLPLGSNLTVSASSGVVLTAGNISLGTFNLTNTNATAASNLGTGSSSSMIVATSTGQAILNTPTGAATKTFPIGDGTNYTPVTLTFTANAVAGSIGARVTASTHPQYNNSGAQTDYLSRYWSFTTTGLTTYTYTGAFTYVPADINGTEATIKLNRWNGAAWAEDATSTAASNVLTSTTGISNTTYSLNGTDYTGRKEIASTSYTWNGSVSTDWATAANWTPSGIPAALDNVTINVPGTNTLSINSARTITDFILNGTGTFAATSAGSLTINGNVTYANTAAATLDAASTVSITSASAQTVPSLNYGNLNLTGGNRTLPDAATVGTVGIAGTFTPGAGTFTVTGSTVDFNGSGTQTIPAFSFNNLTSSNTGARTLVSGTINIAGIFTPGTNSYTNTGNTINFNGTGAQTVPAFASFNNLTVSGARTTNNVTFAAGTIGVAGTFTNSATFAGGAFVTTGNTFDYTSAGSQTITGFNKYNNLSNSGNGARTLASSPTIVIDGVYTPTNGAVTIGTGTIDFSSASAQTIPATSYYIITNSGNGARTLASSGTINIGGTSFTTGSGAYTVTGSTVNFSNGTGLTIPAPTPAGTNNYHNLTISGAGAFSQAATLTIGGDFSESAGTYAVSNAATARNLNVAGNFNLTGGTFTVLANTASTTPATVTVTGNTTTSGSSVIVLENVNNSNASGVGIFQTTDFTTTSTATSGIVNFGSVSSTSTVAGNEFRVSGNFSKSGAGTFYTTSTNSATGIVFNKTGTQTFSYSGANSQYTSYVVNAGSTLQMTSGLTMGSATNPLSSFTVNGTLDLGANVLSGTTDPTFTLNSGGKIITANTNGLSGSITVPGTKTFTAGASYEFNSTVANQNFGFTGLTIGNPASITISNTFGPVTPDVNITLGNAASVNVNAGATLAAGVRTFTFGTGGTVNINGTVQTANTSTPSLYAGGTATFVNTNSPTININTSTSVIEFNGAAGQAINSTTYGGVKINNAAGVALGGTVTVSGTLTLTAGDFIINGNSLVLGGAVSRTAGNIRGSLTSNLTVNGTAGSLFFATGGNNNYLKTFTIGASGSATLGNALNIAAYDGVGAEGVLTVTPGGTLASGGFLTIKSNVNGTARIAAGSTSGAYISGNVTVERYIRQNASKSWRLLASNTSGQTINQSWQEGQVGYNVNTNPGFGTMVAGPGASLSAVQAVGYDTLSYGYSMFKYDKTTDNLLPVTNTLTQSLGVEPGFFLFIRGDRGPNQFNTGVGTTPTPPTSATVLRSTGTLFMGDQLAVSTGTPGYAMVRNPYPSRIDMRNIVQGGLLVDAFQVWDPKIGGAFGVGGYQTFFKETDNLDPDFGNYKVTPGGGSYGANLSVQNYIESGAAFFIQSSGGTGTAQVTEACKTSGSSNASYRPSAPLTGSQRLTYNVYADNNGSVDIVDGGLVVFNDAYSNAVDNNDVRKSPNFGENIGIIRSNTDLVVEKRQAINGADTVFFNMNQMRETGYRFDVVISGVDPLITGAILQDKYTGTNTALDITGATNAYTFTVDVNAASKAADRFRVVFRQSTVVPVSFISIKAAQAGKNIAVQWNVASEVNVASYEVEKSTDGSRFSKAGTVAAKQAATYNWLDENAVNGSNYYRIKSVDNNGQAKYSSIVKVTIGKAGAVITVSPNPVQGNFINIQFTEEPAGKYGVRLINIAGQVVYNRTMQHAGGSASQTFTLPSALVSGVYQLEILAPDNSRHTEKLIVNAGN